MTAVTVSPKYQLVIPRHIRQELGIKAGQKVQVLAYRNRIELVPLQPISTLKGSLKGLDTRVARDTDRL